MNETLYSAAASILRYFFLALMVYVIMVAAVRSIKEYRRMRNAQRIAGLEIRGIELLAPDDYAGKWISLGTDNTIGSGVEDDVSLPESDLKKAHMRIYEYRGEMLLKTRQKRFCEINGQRPRGKRIPLTDGDVVWARDVCFRCLKRRPMKEEGPYE